MVAADNHLTMEALEAGLDEIRLKLVSSAVGKQLNLRGVNAKVVQPGVIRIGCTVKKL